MIKTCSYNDVTLSPDGKGIDANDAVVSKDDGKNSCVIYSVGSDKTVKQIHESTVLKEVDLHTLTLSSLVLSNDGTMLFSGTCYNFRISIEILFILKVLVFLCQFMVYRYYIS